MDELVNTILHGDCIAGLNALPEGSADLVFADPPFNIGYDYDVYRDELKANEYLAWSRDWIGAVYRALSPRGTFWLAIGDEYAAELKIESQKIGFIPRSWVVWYYTFGVNCTHKFTRSHAHLFYFVKNRRHFTFRAAELENRVPSARQLVYNDSRANEDGRLPDDTWIIRPADVVGDLIADDGTWTVSELPAVRDDDHTWTLRPQDLAERFSSSEDTWYFPRVAGTFKERAGFHGCQMPEQLLGRIIRLCSNESDLVVDPFSGSATTLAVAKKLGRRFVGFDISRDYVKLGRERLKSIRVGDRLEGSPEPTMSAPQTWATGGRMTRRGPVVREKASSDDGHRSKRFEERLSEQQLASTLQGIAEAFRRIHNGFSADRVVADPLLNEEFAQECERIGVVGDARLWNMLLFRLRKAGKLVCFATTRRTDISWADCDSYLFASEIALQKMLRDDKAKSLDEILCDPTLASEFDKVAKRYAVGRTPLEYRWAALKLRKQAKFARTRSAALKPPKRLTPPQFLEKLEIGSMPERSGVYILLHEREKRIYVGETLNLRTRFNSQFNGDLRINWMTSYPDLRLQTYMPEIHPGDMLAWQSCLVKRYKPELNFQELCRSR
jgi:site-specific DNA-methyltransferase (adenine-specific)